MERIIAGIDVGTTKICTLVGEVDEGGALSIVGVGVVPSRGLRKGVVVNVGEATEAIAASVEKAERVSGYEIERAYVGVAGAHISCVNSRGMVAISRGRGGITQDDINRALEAARAIAIPYDRSVIHVIPRGYIVDGQDGVRDPIGMHGFRLEVEVHIVTGAAASIHNLTKCVQDLGIEVEDLVLSPLAAGEAVLTDNEREMGVVLADIGGGTTDIAIFVEDTICHAAVLPVGGNHLTNDLAVGLRAPFGVYKGFQIKVKGHPLSEHGRTITAKPGGEGAVLMLIGNGAKASRARRSSSRQVKNTPADPARRRRSNSLQETALIIPRIGKRLLNAGSRSPCV